ncbi:hypothetical protein WG66_004866 [Moniliophthora roreri]|uniref:Uncharacterized protein n=1 Tax=Moniliophthora roreri TaxID=221103 RepID=A0A0W0EUR8_MONRR|nr:hypothetical protein WG66_004866 [Moniliophthora roreri]
MVQELIPRPKTRQPISPESGKRVAPILNIGQILIAGNIMDAVVYEQFKFFVRGAATKHLPDTVHKHNTYDARLWRRVVSEQYPQLKKCFRAWPIEDYYNYWAKDSRKTRSSRVRKSVIGASGEVGRRSSRFPSRASSPSLHQSAGYVNSVSHSNGSPALQSGRNTVSWIQNPSRVQDITSHPDCRLTIEVDLSAHPEVRMVKKEQSEFLLQSSALFDQSSISQPRTYSFDARTLVEKYPEVCNLCGTPPQILEEHQAELINFLTTNNMTDVFPALKSFGVLHDGHLRILMSLDNHDQDEVMAGILSRPDMMAFMKHLRHASVSISNSDVVGSPMVTDCRSARFDGPISRRLVKFMKSQRLEVLVPIATAPYGITGDLQFERRESVVVPSEASALSITEG